MNKKIVIIGLMLAFVFSLFYGVTFYQANSLYQVYICQVGIFSNQDNANQMIQKMSNLEFKAGSYQSGENNIVIAGAYEKEDIATQHAQVISSSGQTVVIKKYEVSEACFNQVKNEDYTLLFEELKN